MFRKFIIIIVFISVYIESLLISQAQVAGSLLALIFIFGCIILAGTVVYFKEDEVEAEAEVEVKVEVEAKKEPIVHEPSMDARVDSLFEDLVVETGVEEADLGLDEDDIIAVIEIDPDTSKEVIELDNTLLKEKAIETDLDIDIEKLMLNVEDDPELIEQIKAIDNLGKEPVIEDSPFTDPDISDSIELIEKEV